MLNIIRFLDIRVAVFLLILTAGSFAAPSQASGDKPAAAVLGPDMVLPAAPVAGFVTAVSETASTVSAFDATSWAEGALGAVDRYVFALALASAERAVERGNADPSTLTVIDFSVPSTERRMFVYDLRSRELLFEEHVSHGPNSGHDVPTMFSNQPESFKSSIGLYRAAESYVGKHGYSLRLDGLEKGFNDRARERAIVIHGADYVNARTARAQGRLGRSLGCPAVRPEISRPLIDAVKDGGLVFAYYPDPAWLSGSVYLP
jgi:hypothetical protein